MPGLAQEGHPLTGTWSGDWGPDLDDRTHVTLVLRYDDNNELTGLINPGPNSIPVSAVALDVTDWTVRIEATAQGAPVRIEGRLENIESYHRTISGTWRQGSVEGELTLTRD
jgi:hypothetical protein